MSKSGYRRLRDACLETIAAEAEASLELHTLRLHETSSEAERKPSDETAMLKKQLGIAQQDVTAAKSAFKSMEECQRLKLQCSSRENR